jgi:hypothetical protein
MQLNNIISYNSTYSTSHSYKIHLILLNRFKITFTVKFIYTKNLCKEKWGKERITAHQESMQREVKKAGRRRTLALAPPPGPYSPMHREAGGGRREPHTPAVTSPAPAVWSACRGGLRPRTAPPQAAAPPAPDYSTARRRHWRQEK